MFAVPLMIVLFLIISMVFFFQRKPFSFLQNSILYMVFKILATNVTTIVTLNLDFIKKTEDPFLFPAYLLNRDGIIPLLLLIFINRMNGGDTPLKKVFYTFIIFACLNGLVFLMVELKLIEFLEWNYLETAVVNGAYLLVAFGAGKLLSFITRRSTWHDSRV
ncbi:hypothetical protein ACOJQI_12395 [Bacillus salacetis]|uniref:hypothetical protein n=1 Tax=Bacillus salacetis TaxID=2315464 RepID=UPI003BA1CB90